MAIASAILAILIWSSLATLSVSLKATPPLFLIGASLLLGGSLSIPWAKKWSLDWKTIATGCYGMLLYHLLLVLALRLAPPVSANLVHYTWPMLIVLLTPLFVRDVTLRLSHVVCASLGFVGAALAVSAGADGGTVQFSWGYVLALGAGLVWATYSLLIRAHSMHVSNIGLSCLVSGGVALCLHFLVEPPVQFAQDQVFRMVMLGIGPMGAAFYLWAFSLRKGDTRVIGVLANVTPVLSSLMLVASGYGSLTAGLLLACFLVTIASLVSIRSSSPKAIQPEAV